MLFNSYIFMLLFLPITLTGYYSFNKQKMYNISKAFLILMSLIFYAYFNFSYLFIIIGSIVFNYLISYSMLHYQKSKIRPIIFIFSLLINIGSLFYFKYYDFFISNVNAIFSTSYALKKIILPLGISFFTFQQISFIIDSYKNEVPLYNFLDY